MALLWCLWMAIGVLAGPGVSQDCTAPPEAQNLALRRPATQSSTFNDQIEKSEPGRAVDGNHKGGFEQGSCSHTGRDMEPWWNVDLGKRHSVSVVIVKNREDECCWERLKGAQIHVGNSLVNHGKDNPICGTINATRPGALSTVCCRGLEGRYVTIVIPGRAEYLTLCEVEVLSQSCDPPSGAQNLALRRPAAQSSSFLGTIFDMAGNAVDGNRNGDWERGSCSLTRRDTEPWWTVDLGRPHSVSMVMVKNREDGTYWKRLKGAEIHVGNSLTDNGRSNPLCGTINDTAPGSLSTICCNGREGRYVTITIPGRAEYLSLCEVEVLSQSCVRQSRAFNLALGRPATQSSTLANMTAQAVAGRAVDGKHDGKLEQGSCSQTQRDMEPWWNVDLVGRYSIAMVTVKHLEDQCCGERLKGAEIHVGDSPVNHGKNNPLCGTITETKPGALSTICCNGLAGRYITIVIPGRVGNLTLCEVEVLSQGCASPPSAAGLSLTPFWGP